MGKVDCLRWPGCGVWFWPRDHREPHFHVKSPGKRMKSFLRKVRRNREKLYVEWDAKVEVQD